MDRVQKWGGEISYTIPYTGNYEISLSGSQGSAYDNSSGGYGYTLIKKVRLQKGDVLQIVTPNKPTGYSANGAVITIPSGEDGVLYVNGVESLRAGGGVGFVNNSRVPWGITSVKTEKRSYSVHWHSGNGYSGANSHYEFPQLDTRNNPGGCYTNSWHTHDSRCTYEQWHTHERCVNHWVNDDPTGGTGGWSWTEHHCTHHSKHEGDTRDNHYSIGCGYSQGQVVGINNQHGDARGCSGSYDSCSVSNTGNAKFSIRLCEQQSIMFHSVATRVPYYTNTKCNLIITDGTVAYFKRP